MCRHSFKSLEENKNILIQIKLLVGVLHSSSSWWYSSNGSELVDRVNILEAQMPLAVVIRGRLLFPAFSSF